MSVAPSVHEVLHHLHSHGWVSLPGGPSEPFRRMLRARRRWVWLYGGLAGVGAIAAVVGLTLRDAGFSPLLIVFGGIFVVMGGMAAVLMWALIHALEGRRLAEYEPVVLDAAGIRLRGIGLIPWVDVAPPERRRILTKNDVGGVCAVMPLTASGHARVNASMAAWTQLVGPRPYLQLKVPHLLLPGIDGLTEEEARMLFGAAHQWFAPRG